MPKGSKILNNKTALITGAASGIGQGIAERFVEAGAGVAIFDIDGDGAERLCRLLGKKGGALAIQGDVSREKEVEAAVRQTVRHFGRLDTLVNNAGIEISGPAPDLDTSDWDRQMDVNLKGAFLFSKYAIPHMRGRGGVILNISSVHAFVSYPASAPYDASKAALVALTRTMAIDHGREGIRVNAICPGYINTNLTKQWLEQTSDPEETMRQVLAAHPLARIGEPRDIAEAALFLASEAASFITGAFLVVDGGLLAAGR